MTHSHPSDTFAPDTSVPDTHTSADLAARARPEAPSLAIGVAGDDAGAVRDASAFVRRLGFDPVPVGALAASGILGPRSAVFGAVLDADGFRRRLAEDGWSA